MRTGLPRWVLAVVTALATLVLVVLLTRGEPGQGGGPAGGGGGGSVTPVTPVTTYNPELDGEPDPGEVVWAWVPYEDDPSQGKDRPVLVIGRDGTTLTCLYMTSKDHDRDAEDEASWGRYWMDIGSGAWDREGRPSEIRLDRLVLLEEDDVRREGAIMERELFDAVIEAARPHWN